MFVENNAQEIQATPTQQAQARVMLREIRAELSREFFNRLPPNTTINLYSVPVSKDLPPRAGAPSAVVKYRQIILSSAGFLALEMRRDIDQDNPRVKERSCEPGIFCRISDEDLNQFAQQICNGKLTNYLADRTQGKRSQIIYGGDPYEQRLEQYEEHILKVTRECAERFSSGEAIPILRFRVRSTAPGITMGMPFIPVEYDFVDIMIRSAQSTFWQLHPTLLDKYVENRARKLLDRLQDRWTDRGLRANALSELRHPNIEIEL